MKEIIFKTKPASSRDIRLLTKKSPNTSSVTITALLLYGSWNAALSRRNDHVVESEEIEMQSHRNSVANWILQATKLLPTHLSEMLSYGDSYHQVLSVKVDQCSNTMDVCISDNSTSISTTKIYHEKDRDGDVNMNHHSDKSKGKDQQLSIQAPPDLPALILLAKNKYKSHLVHIDFDHVKLIHCLINQDRHSTRTSYFDALLTTIEQNISSSIEIVKHATPSDDLTFTRKKNVSTGNSELNQPISRDISTKNQIRIFVAGDRSQVGKSSVCLGLIGTLLTKYNFDPSKLAYIKPATQCEESQLISKYCDQHSILNQPIGPIVYYKGFTRAFLNGETDDSNVLLQQVKEAVDTIALDKEVVIIDGVGYPAVGSVCGTDNVNVALACSYKNQNGNIIPPAVLIVGRKGVGDAIDSYNINATYFRAKDIRVIGAIFNRLPNDENDFYSLENCKTAVSSYFENQLSQMEARQGEEVFGFIPEVQGLSDQSIESTNTFINLFSKYVNLSRILDRAIALRDSGDNTTTISDHHEDNHEVHIRKKLKVIPQQQQRIQKSRAEIEKKAKAQGARGG